MPQGHCNFHMPGWISCLLLSHLQCEAQSATFLLSAAAPCRCLHWSVKGQRQNCTWLLAFTPVSHNEKNKTNVIYLFCTWKASKREQEEKASLRLHVLVFWWVRAVTTLVKTIYFESISKWEVRFVALVKFSTHFTSFFCFFFHSKQRKTTPIHLWWVNELRGKKKDQFNEKYKPSLINVNTTISIFLIYQNFP